jgi:predicted permease
LGVLLTIVAIAVSGSAGVAAERRWPETAVGWARRALVVSLYTLIPFVVFFNLARTHINADEAGGLVIGWVAILTAAGLAWLVGSRVLELSRPATG